MQNDFQKIGTDNYEAMSRSFGELNKGSQAIFARWVEFSKRSFEDATRTWEKLIAVKSLDQAFEIQTYVKNAYENWMAEMSRSARCIRPPHATPTNRSRRRWRSTRLKLPSSPSP
jgi:hypothetical protein